MADQKQTLSVCYADDDGQVRRYRRHSLDRSGDGEDEHSPLKRRRLDISPRTNTETASDNQTDSDVITRPVRGLSTDSVLMNVGNDSQASGNDLQATGNDLQATGNDLQATGNDSQTTGNDSQTTDLIPDVLVQNAEGGREESEEESSLVDIKPDIISSECAIDCTTDSLDLVISGPSATNNGLIKTENVHEKASTITPSVSTSVITPSVSTSVITPSVSTSVITPSVSTSTITPSVSTSVITPSVSTSVITPSVSTSTITPSVSASIVTGTPGHSEAQSTPVSSTSSHIGSSQLSCDDVQLPLGHDGDQLPERPGEVTYEEARAGLMTALAYIQANNIFPGTSFKCLPRLPRHR